MTTLLALDVLGIQRFILGSARLMHIRGASRLVADATRHDGPLVRALLQAHWPGGGPLLHEGEVLLGAGGNLVLEIDDPQRATAVVTFCGAWLAATAPDLAVAVASRQVGDGELVSRVADLFRHDLPLAKLDRRPGSRWVPPQVQRDPASGEPVTGLGRHDAVGAAQLEAERSLRSRGLHWDTFLTPGTRFGNEEEWRTKGEQSWYAVVHLDGNGVGAGIARWFEEHDGDADDVFRSAYRRLATDLHTAAESAFRRVVQELGTLALEHGEIPGTAIVPSIPCLDDRAGRALPVRPVLVAGDDVTFLCDARIAMWAATRAVTAFSAQIGGFGPVTASAGIAYQAPHSRASSALAAAEASTRCAKQRYPGEAAIAWSGLGAQVQEPMAVDLHGAHQLADDLAKLREAPWGERHAAVKRVVSLARAEGSGRLPGGITDVEVQRLDDRGDTTFPVRDTTRLHQLAELLDLALFPTRAVPLTAEGRS